MNEQENTAQAAQANEANGEQPAASELEVAQAALKESQNKYLYLYAEFENHKKRVIKERSDLLKFGHESFSRELLQIADNLDRALDHAGGASTEALVTGIRMVSQQLKETLSKFGVSAIPAVGTKFNPELHEAVGQEKLPADAPAEQDGFIVKEHQKGYTIHGRLLRPARVVIGTR